MKKHRSLQKIVLVVVAVAVCVLAILYVLFIPRGIVHAPVSQTTQYPN